MRGVPGVQAQPLRRALIGLLAGAQQLVVQVAQRLGARVRPGGRPVPAPGQAVHCEQPGEGLHRVRHAVEGIRLAVPRAVHHHVEGQAVRPGGQQAQQAGERGGEQVKAIGDDQVALKQRAGRQPGEQLALPVLPVGQLAGHGLFIRGVEQAEVAQLGAWRFLRVQPFSQPLRADVRAFQLADRLQQLAGEARLLPRAGVAGQVASQLPQHPGQGQRLAALVNQLALVPACPLKDMVGQARGGEHLQAEEALDLKGLQRVALRLEGVLLGHQQQRLPPLPVGRPEPGRGQRPQARAPPGHDVYHKAPPLFARRRIARRLSCCPEYSTVAAPSRGLIFDGLGVQWGHGPGAGWPGWKERPT